MLVQTKDQSRAVKESEGRIPTKTKIKDPQMSQDLDFAMTVAKHVKSNAIVLARNLTTIGVGAGQMSRIDATKVAFMKASEFKHATAGSVLASDGFFPFSDCARLAHEQQVAAIIQPGGSIRDEESIGYCDQVGLPMVFSGKRHFKH